MLKSITTTLHRARALCCWLWWFCPLSSHRPYSITTISICRNGKLLNQLKTPEIVHNFFKQDKSRRCQNGGEWNHNSWRSQWNKSSSGRNTEHYHLQFTGCRPICEHDHPFGSVLLHLHLCIHQFAQQNFLPSDARSHFFFWQQSSWANIEPFHQGYWNYWWATSFGRIRFKFGKT